MEKRRNAIAAVIAEPRPSAERRKIVTRRTCRPAREKRQPTRTTGHRPLGNWLSGPRQPKMRTAGPMTDRRIPGSAEGSLAGSGMGVFLNKFKRPHQDKIMKLPAWGDDSGDGNLFNVGVEWRACLEQQRRKPRKKQKCYNTRNPTLGSGRGAEFGERLVLEEEFAQFAFAQDFREFAEGEEGNESEEGDDAPGQQLVFALPPKLGQPSGYSDSANETSHHVLDDREKPHKQCKHECLVDGGIDERLVFLPMVKPDEFANPDHLGQNERFDDRGAVIEVGDLILVQNEAAVPGECAEEDSQVNNIDEVPDQFMGEFLLPGPRPHAAKDVMQQQQLHNAPSPTCHPNGERQRRRCGFEGRKQPHASYGPLSDLHLRPERTVVVFGERHGYGIISDREDQNHAHLALDRFVGIESAQSRAEVPGFGW